jgi:heptosyltransferase-2
MSASPRILIVAPAWLGDMVMAHSLIQVLKSAPDAPEISLLAPRSTLQLSELMPEISERILMPDTHGEFNLKIRWTLARRLVKEGFAAAYVLPNTWKAALVPFLARIPRRIGAKGEQRYGLLNDLRHGIKRLPLMVERYVALASPAGVFQAGMPVPHPRLVVPEALRAQVEQQFSLTRRKGQKILVLSPGAAYGPAKRWPPAYFAAVATQRLAEGERVLIIGSPAEMSLAAEIDTLAPGVENLVGKTNLLEMAAVLACADQVLTNDSGPMHIAASLGVPTFAIFGSSSPGFTPPLGPRVFILEKHRLPCRPCFERTCPLKHYACLMDLTPAAVLAWIDAS